MNMNKKMYILPGDERTMYQKNGKSYLNII